MYLSPRFSVTDPRRRAALASGDAPASSGGIVGGPSPAQQAQTGTGEPGAYRAFFEANRGAGQQLFQGLADDISKRIDEAGGRFGALPTQVPTWTAPPNPQVTVGQLEPWLQGGPKGIHADPTGRLVSDETTPNPENIQSRAEITQPISADLARLGQGAEGFQTLLGQKGPGYTGAMGRLDSWLAAAASDPARIKELQDRLAGLGAEPAGPPPGAAPSAPAIPGGGGGDQPAAPGTAPKQRKTVRGYLYGV